MCAAFCLNTTHVSIVQTMSKLIELNKNELICKIQSINREKHRLKTLLSKHDLLIHLYEKLHQNCLQINGLRDGRSRQQMETKLRSTQSHLLSQIQLISKCDKSLHISLPRPPFDDLIVSQLFKEMSTQYDTNDLLCPNRAHNDIQVNPLNPLIDCNGVNGVNGFSDAIIDDKSTKCIEININETSNDGSTPIPNSTPLSDQMMAEIVSTDRCSTDAMNGMNDMISSLDTPLESKADQKKALKKYVCDYCGKRYKIEKTRDKHIISIHKYITSESMKTNDKIPNEEPIEERIEESIEEPMDEKPAIEAKSQSMLTCQWPDCGLTFTNRTHFLRHQSIHNESRKVCSECGLRFEDANHLREHMIWHSNQSHNNNNNTDINRVESDVLLDSDMFYEIDMKTDYNYDWNSVEHQLRHNNIHSNKMLLFCDFANCDYKTTNSNHLEVHQKRAHDKVYISL